MKKIEILNRLRKQKESLHLDSMETFKFFNIENTLCFLYHVERYDGVDCHNEKS